MLQGRDNAFKYMDLFVFDISTQVKFLHEMNISFKILKNAQELCDNYLLEQLSKQQASRLWETLETATLKAIHYEQLNKLNV